MDYGLTERMISCLFEGSFKKQAKFNRFVQQWKENVTLTLEPVPVHSEKATADTYCVDDKLFVSMGHLC